MQDIDEITGCIVDAAYKIHTGLGPGLLESVYEVVLACELQKRGLVVERQKVISFEFDGIRFDEGLKVGLPVEGKVIVELKSVEKLASVHAKQVITYLRLLHLPVGLLINFGSATLKEGLQRIVNNYQPSAALREHKRAAKIDVEPVGCAVICLQKKSNRNNSFLPRFSLCPPRLAKHTSCARTINIRPAIVEWKCSFIHYRVTHWGIFSRRQ